jgi:hypothetical protein
VGGWLAGGLLAIAVLAGASAAIAAAPDRQDALQAFDRDVYVIVGASLRNPTADTPGDARLFSVVGAALPATWGEWQGASARSQVRTQPGNGGPSTDVRLTLSGLIPGGVYSVFYGTLGPDSEHPLCPGVDHGRVEGALLEADQVFFSVVYHFDGRTSHPFPNRGELFTQGGECRASYGEDAMRQLLILQSGFGS